MDLLQNIQTEVDDLIQAQRPYWPGKPTACPVCACGVAEYSSWASFRRHRNHTHKERVTQYAWIRCRKLLYRLDACTRHQRKVQGVPEPTKEGTDVPNDRFFNPGGVLPYKADLREKVASKRKAQSTSGDVLVTEGEGVCRDQFLDLDTGVVVYKKK